MAIGDTQTRHDRIREHFTVHGGQLVDRVRELVAAGNVRLITIKHDGKVVAEFPLTAGVVGTLLAPQVAALGAIAALVTESTIEIVRTDEPASPDA